MELLHTETTRSDVVFHREMAGFFYNVDNLQPHNVRVALPRNPRMPSVPMVMAVRREITADMKVSGCTIKRRLGYALATPWHILIQSMWERWLCPSIERFGRLLREEGVDVSNETLSSLLSRPVRTIIAGFARRSALEVSPSETPEP